MTTRCQQADPQLCEDATDLGLIPIREFAREHFHQYGRQQKGSLEEDGDEAVEITAPSPHTQFYTTSGELRNPKDKPETEPIPDEVEVNGVKFTKQEVNIMLRVSNPQA